MKIDLKKWNERRLKVEAEIKELDRSIRLGGGRMGLSWNKDTRKYEPKMIQYGPGQGTCGDWEKLHALQHEATSLYATRALLRNKLHRQKIVWYSGQGLRNEEVLTIEHERETWNLSKYVLPEEVTVAA